MNKLKINTNWYECMQEFFFYTGRIRAKALANFFTEKSDLQFINSKGALFHNLIASLTHDDWNIDHWRWSERYILTRADHIKKNLEKKNTFWKHYIAFYLQWLSLLVQITVMPRYAISPNFYFGKITLEDLTLWETILHKCHLWGREDKGLNPGKHSRVSNPSHSWTSSMPSSALGGWVG